MFSSNRWTSPQLSSLPLASRLLTLLSVRSLSVSFPRGDRVAMRVMRSIIGGKWATRHVPEKLRFMLAAESAANDGLAYPFLSISLYLTLEGSPRDAFAKWLVIGCLCKYSEILVFHQMIM